MKCLILAGGSGDRLWPLSRKNYPKQFMEINNNRSLLQETVVRNLPFCDEFLISTNSAYHFIVSGQMKAFQGLTYRCFLEEIPGGTAAAVALICMLSNPSELVLVVSADTVTGDEHYQEAVLKAKELARQNHIVVFGTPAVKKIPSCGYIEHISDVVTAFHAGADEATADRLIHEGNALIHTGMSMFSAGSIVRALRNNMPELYSSCIRIVKRIKKGMDTVVFPKELMKDIKPVSLESAVFKNTSLRVVNGTFLWKNVDSYEDIADSDNPVISQNCKNSIVINTSDKHLVVTNEISDVTVVHTKDVTFVGRRNETDSVKQLITSYAEKYPMYFNDHNVLYYPYGTQEILVNGTGYKVKKTVVYPGYSLNRHRHLNRREHWTVTEGKAIVTVGDKKFPCDIGDSVDIGENEFHEIENTGEGALTIIRTITGKTDSGFEISDEAEKGNKRRITSPNIVKLQPVFKDYLWGGSRIKTELNKKTDLEKVAESWELSAHEDGQSIIAEGPYKGLRFGKYLNLIGKEAWGWKAASMPRFPVLIKFLDSEEPLSLQVHPDDEYALTHENEYGKYEMWYILDAKEGAKIYQGFNRAVTDEEIRERINNATLHEVLNERSVKNGDTIFIEPGCVHALGEGILVCEIQQNSNSTYRLYDYDRLDAFMNKRPLHIEKALDVIINSPDSYSGNESSPAKNFDGFMVQELGSCKYFVSSLYDIVEKAKLDIDESSFVSILVIDGNAKISDGNMKTDISKGDSLFLKAGKYSVNIEGKCKCVVTHV